MNQQILARKRTRSQAFSKQQLQEGEPSSRKRQILEVYQAQQTQENSSHQHKKEKHKKEKEIRKKQKKVQENINKEQNSAKKQQQSKPVQNQQENEKKKKKKRKQKDDKDQKEQKRKRSQAKVKKNKKKGQKKEKENNSDQDVKQQQTNKDTDKQKGEQKQKNKKKKKHKNKEKQLEQQQIKKPAESSINAKEQQDQNEKSKKKKDSQKKSKKSKKSKKGKKKKKKKEQSGSSSESQSDQVQSNKQSSDEDNEKTKKIKKGDKKRKGRKPLGPVKRKKSSIFEQQQVINKKYRVKKKSTYLNKMSDRAWGQLRAGPYRNVKKYTKAQQRKIIDNLLGDGPKKQTLSLQKENKQDQSVKIQNQQHMQIQEQITVNYEKMEEQTHKNQQDSSDDQKSKSKSKQKKKTKKGKNLDDNQKETAQSTKASKSTKSKTKTQKKSKKKKKKKKEDKSSEESDEENQAKIQNGDENTTKSKSKKKKKRAKDDSDSSSSSQQQGKKRKRKKAKKDVKHQGSRRVKQKKEEDIHFSKQDSQRIIDLFSVDGGNYPEMMKELAGIPLKKVRLHLRMLFHRALDIITYQALHRCGRNIMQWQQDQKVQIVRQLHRIRSSNRLLSQANVHFREKMTTLMKSYNDQTWLEKVSDSDMQAMYKKLQAFVRGYNTINRSKRNGNASITQSKNKQKQQRYKFNKEVTRKPILCGGHLISKSMKSEYKDQTVQSEFNDRSKSVLPPQKLIQEWNREEEKALCQLYVNNQLPDEAICEKLKERYGPNIKWRDFQLLGRKIDQLIKFALIKLQNLTALPYCRQQRERQIQKKRARLQQKLKRENEHYSMNYYKQKLKTTSMFLYDNEIFQKEERLQYKHRIFKNLSLLERQIFGHIESYRLKNTLVKILTDQFPSQEDVEAAVKEAKRFSRWAREDQKKSNITSIKNVFIGERQDRDFRDDDQNQDSIMADIQKIEITRKQGYMPQSKQLSDQVAEQKSILFAQTASGRAQQPIQIQNDNDSVQISDFEQPQSVKSNSNSHSKPSGQKFEMLQKLYQSLNTQSK